MYIYFRNIDSSLYGKYFLKNAYLQLYSIQLKIQQSSKDWNQSDFTKGFSDHVYRTCFLYCKDFHFYISYIMRLAPQWAYVRAHKKYCTFLRNDIWCTETYGIFFAIYQVILNKFVKLSYTLSKCGVNARDP